LKWRLKKSNFFISIIYFYQTEYYVCIFHKNQQHLPQKGRKQFEKDEKKNPFKNFFYHIFYGTLSSCTHERFICLFLLRSFLDTKYFFSCVSFHVCPSNLIPLRLIIDLFYFLMCVTLEITKKMIMSFVAKIWWNWHIFEM